MNVVVCVKQVPDTWGERKLDPETKTLDRGAVEGVINEVDEYAVEEALRLKEAHEGEVTVLTMGPNKASDSIRKALSMGADKAVHVVDDALAGSDAVATAKALSQALGRIGFDVVVLGSESTDARMAVLPAMLSELTGAPQLSLAMRVDVDGRTVCIERQTDYGHDKVEGELPVVVSVVEKINEPRYPSFKGIMAAKKKPVETLSVTDLELDASSVGLAGAATEVVDFAARPPREAGTIVPDEGEGGTKAAEYLAGQKLV